MQLLEVLGSLGIQFQTIARFVVVIDKDIDRVLGAGVALIRKHDGDNLVLWLLKTSKPLNWRYLGRLALRQFALCRVRVRLT